MGAASQYPGSLKLKFQYFTARMYAFLFDADSVLEIRARHFSSSRKHIISGLFVILRTPFPLGIKNWISNLLTQNLPLTIKLLFIS